VVCFGKTAENCAEYLKKGSQVYLEGRLRTSKYTDKEGHEKYSTEIIADTVQFLSKAANSEGSAAGTGGRSDYSKPADDINF
jgi:single-strand DNA-binding protein